MDICDNSHSVSSEEEVNSCQEVITRVITDLFSYDDTKRRRVIEQYYFPNALFTSPILQTSGAHSIKHVLLVWKTLNKIPPKITKICFDGKTCIAFLTQTLCPRMFPWIQIDFPVTVVLEFKETALDSGLLKIVMHEEHWTIEGLLKATPIISFWYDHVLRPMVGRLLSVTGEAVYTATETAALLVRRNKELEEARQRLEAGNCMAIDRYRTDRDLDQEYRVLRIKNAPSANDAASHLSD